MKKQIFTNTILYTHNTLVPVTKENIAISSQFGKLLNNRYEYNIVWVPENASSDGSTRKIYIMPQYKFGHSDDSDSSFVDALTNPKIHNISPQPFSTTSTFNSIVNKGNYTNSIVLKLQSTVINNTLTINSTLSNYSSFLVDTPNNFYYNLAFRLAISIYNVTTTTTEDTIYSYITDARFGRSTIQKPGTPPSLPWDIDVHGVVLPPGTPFPQISPEPSVVVAFDRQIEGYAGVLGIFNFN